MNINRPPRKKSSIASLSIYSPGSVEFDEPHLSVFQRRIEIFRVQRDHAAPPCGIGIDRRRRREYYAAAIVVMRDHHRE